MFLFLSMGRSVLLEQAGAKAGFDRQGRHRGSVTRFLAVSDSGVVTGLPLLGTVVAHTEPDADQQQHRGQRGA
jgi:hypothetical protein